MKNLLLFACMLMAWLLGAQSPQQALGPEALAKTITARELKTYVDTLASDAMEGRETGTEGQRMAAEYIAAQFEAWGLPRIGDGDTYFQKIGFITENWEEISLRLNGEELRHLQDYYAFPSLHPEGYEAGFEEIVFLGYGIDTDEYSDYEKADVAGKAVLIYAGEPMDQDSMSYVTGSAEVSSWARNPVRKIEMAKEKGAAAVFLIDDNFKRNLSFARRVILNRRLQLGYGEDTGRYSPSYFISSSTARQILGGKLKKVIQARKRIRKKGKSKPVNVPVALAIEESKRVQRVQGENVLGYIEGTDPRLKDELVILSAHFDHLGKRGDAIYNGADDNASGTSTVLEVTEAFVEAKKNGVGPRRSVLALLVSGEEKGLLGSQYYVKNPVFPLENTVVDINVDMVGRVDEKYSALDNPNYIYVIGADRMSTQLHEINEQVNEQYTQLKLDYTYNAEDDPNQFYYRSDHYNFARNGIPAIFYFNGTHEDYHQPSDTAEKIQFDKMATIGQLVFHTAWEIANRDQRLVVDVVDTD